MKAPVVVKIGTGKKLHLAEEEFRTVPGRAESACGRIGDVVEVDLATDERGLCSTCCWRLKPSTPVES